MDRGERRAGQDGSHGEEGRAGRDHRHAQVITPAAASRINKISLSRTVVQQKSIEQRFGLQLPRLLQHIPLT